MKKINLLFVFLFLSVCLSNFTFPSTVLVTGTDKVVDVTWTNPYTLNPEEVYAGTLNGTLDGIPAKFYCIDINHYLYFDGVPYTDNGNTIPKITYILNTYYPFVPLPYSGALAEEREAAAIQMAIWYFSDGLDVTTLVGNADILLRAQQIIADANLNAGNLVTNVSLVIIPTGIPTEFYVTALDQNNNPLPGVTVNLTSTTGTLSSSSAITGPDGKTPVITVSLLPDYTAEITAEASVTMHQGILYVRSIDPEGYQKLVLAHPYPLHRQVNYEFNGVLPVELSSFTSNVNGRDVSLIWETKTEKNSDKFVIEREAIGANWEAIGSVKAAMLSNSPKQYSFLDRNLQSGKYQYRLKMIDNDGTFQYSSVVEVVVEVPNEYSLMQNYPNPFNPSTVINYSIPKDGKVTLKVFDITGKEAAILVNENQKAGSYSVNFDAHRLSSGVYFYTLGSGSFIAAKKLTIIK